MRSLIAIYVFATYLCAPGCYAQDNFVRVAETEIDQAKLKVVSNLTDRILQAQKKEGHYAFKEGEATQEMIKGLTKNIQQQAYIQIRNLFGDYKSLKFDHLMQTNSGVYYAVYRYRGLFEKENSEVEVRAVLNEQGKLAGFFVRPWQDAL